jgi:hypothetical protein
MPGLLLVNAQDVSRSLGDDPASSSVKGVQAYLEEHYLRRTKGGFNHDPSIRVAHDMFRGSTTKAEGKRYCLANGNPKGRAQNAEIVDAIGDYAEANVSICHRIGYVAVAVGRRKDQTILVGIKAPFIRVRAGNAFLVIPGFRKLARPQGWQIDFVCSLAAKQLARDDYERATPEYLYAGPGDQKGKRQFQSYRGSDLNLYSEDRVDDFLQIYVEAVVKLLEVGRGAQPARTAGYRIIDPSQGAFF